MFASTALHSAAALQQSPLSPAINKKKASDTMADDQTPNTTAMPELPSDDQLLAKARNYQVEMLEESLKKNIIVAVSVWSGKLSKQTDNLRRLDSDSYPADGHRFWEDTHVRALFHSTYIRSQRCRARIVVATAEAVRAATDTAYTVL